VGVLGGVGWCWVVLGGVGCWVLCLCWCWCWCGVGVVIKVTTLAAFLLKKDADNQQFNLGSASLNVIIFLDS